MHKRGSKKWSFYVLIPIPSTLVTKTSAAQVIARHLWWKFHHVITHRGIPSLRWMWCRSGATCFIGEPALCDWLLRYTTDQSILTAGLTYARSCLLIRQKRCAIVLSLLITVFISAKLNGEISRIFRRIYPCCYWSVRSLGRVTLVSLLLSVIGRFWLGIVQLGISVLSGDMVF